MPLPIGNYVVGFCGFSSKLSTGQAFRQASPCRTHRRLHVCASEPTCTLYHLVYAALVSLPPAQKTRECPHRGGLRYAPFCGDTHEHSILEPFPAKKVGVRVDLDHLADLRVGLLRAFQSVRPSISFASSNAALVTSSLISLGPAGRYDTDRVVSPGENHDDQIPGP